MSRFSLHLYPTRARREKQVRRAAQLEIGAVQLDRNSLALVAANPADFPASLSQLELSRAASRHPPLHSG